jgi:hypothetical protein
LYGKQERSQLALPRQALHAFYLAITHPRTGARLGLVAPIAADLKGTLAACGADAQEIASAVLNANASGSWSAARR